MGSYKQRKRIGRKELREKAPLVDTVESVFFSIMLLPVEYY